MQMTEEDMKRAGEMAEKYEWSDEELNLLIKSHKLVLAFLIGRGPKWRLATTPMVHALNSFEGFKRSREQDKKGRERYNSPIDGGKFICRSCDRILTAVVEGEPCYNCSTPHVQGRKTKKG